MLLETLAAACTLLGVLVADCDPRAQAYAEFAADVPAEHWSLVGSVRIEDRSTGKYLRDSGTLVLPAAPRRMALYHEVGHAVFDRLDAEPAWLAAFWQADFPASRLTSYPRELWHKTRDADLVAREDAADSYAYALKGHDGLDPARLVWLTDRWPILAAYAGGPS